MDFSFLNIPPVCVPWWKFKEVPRAHLPVSGSVNFRSLSLTDLPSGPPDDGNEEIALVTIETQGNYDSIEP